MRRVFLVALPWIVSGCLPSLPLGECLGTDECPDHHACIMGECVREDGDAGPSDADPIDAEPSDADPSDAEPIDAEPIDTEPIDAEPIDAKDAGVDAEVGPDADARDADPADASDEDGGFVRTPGTVAEYRFDEGAGTTVFDRSGVAPNLDLAIADELAVTWLPPRGLEIIAPTIIESAAATKIHQRCTSSDEVTIEAWVSTTDLVQGGPARIASIARNTTSVGAMIGQGEIVMNMRVANDILTGRCRTSSTTGAGQDAAIESTPETIKTVPTHAVLVRDSAQTLILYLDGRSSSRVHEGTFNWDPGVRVSLANEREGTGVLDRPWIGTYYFVAVYCFALSQAEVRNNYMAGY